MQNSLISIIVPCYNQAQYLDEALQSVFDQTYSNWECIIVNDGSPDNTDVIAKEWTKKDFRFKYIYQENGGLSSARNVGISFAMGEFILPLDADDKIDTEYCKIALLAFSRDKNVKIVYGRAFTFGIKSEEWILKPFSLKELSLENMIYCSAMFNKNDWIRVHGYDVNMNKGYEDWEFWIAILKNGGTVIKLEEICFYYRIKETSMLLSISASIHKDLYDYVCAKHIDFYIKVFGNYPFFYRQLEDVKNHQLKLSKSKKYVLNLFCKTFFKFEPFRRFKI
jgi:glycosyltransferase involved in cell wall biosynthesis